MVLFHLQFMIAAPYNLAFFELIAFNFICVVAICIAEHKVKEEERMETSSLLPLKLNRCVACRLHKEQHQGAIYTKPR